MDDLYDEFGNYIGEDADNDSIDPENDIGYDDYDIERPVDANALVVHDDISGVEERRMQIEENYDTAIVLHEDKKYYPDASEVYGNAKTIVLDEDAQDITEPIIKPIKTKKFSTLVDTAPILTYTNEFMASLMQTPNLIRNIAVIGHIHHGKTILLDHMVESTHEINQDKAIWNVSQDTKYTDTRKDEQSRLISIKSTPISLVLESLNGKNHLFNLIDTPGHVNFFDEASAALRACDGCLLVVDALEGVMLSTKRLIRRAVQERCEITLVITKLDRLILELRIPPEDAYAKLQLIIDDVNALISTYWFEGYAGTSRGDDPVRVSPDEGTVCFTASQHRVAFSCQSMAKMYCSRMRTTGSTSNKKKNEKNGQINTSTASSTAAITNTVQDDELAMRLWGDWFVNSGSGNKISSKRSSSGSQRTFVHFVLEPLYKLYSVVLSEDPVAITKTFKAQGVSLTGIEARMDAKALLRIALGRFFTGANTGGEIESLNCSCSCVAEMMARALPDPCVGGLQKVAINMRNVESGAPPSDDMEEDSHLLHKAITTCDPNGPLVCNVVKLLTLPEGDGFQCLARIYSGTIKTNQQIRVYGEQYSSNDTEDMTTVTVTALDVPMGRHTLELAACTAGNLILISGIDRPIRKTATFLDLNVHTSDDEVHVFRPLIYDTRPILKLAIEPIVPSALPQMIDALRSVTKSYIASYLQVEDSGEHVLHGTGELQMDCMMHDLRHLHGDLEVKVADPSTAFCETISEISAVKCSAQTTNGFNRMSVIAEPLEEGLALDIEGAKLPSIHDTKAFSSFLMSRYNWDLMASRNVWAVNSGVELDKGGKTGAIIQTQSCGHGRVANVFLDDTISMEVDKKLMKAVKDPFIQGFSWATREGPLCDEPMRGVKFRLLDCEIAESFTKRPLGQLIPASRRVCYSSFLTASPQLLEPVYMMEVQSPAEGVQAVERVLQRRRGHIVSDMPKPGAPFSLVRAYIPVMDSFGFETDLRAHTRGATFNQMVFDHWAVVPGNPLDKDIMLHALEPSPPIALARDFMLKTRRRKGLGDEVNVYKYLDDPDLVEAIDELDLGI